MTAIATVSGEELTKQTHTGDTDWTTILTVGSGEWVAGAVYMLIVRLDGAASSSSFQYGIRVQGGGATLTGSERRLESRSSNIALYEPYLFVTKYTVPGPAEDVTIDYKTYSAGMTVGGDTIQLLAIRLDDDLTEGDDWIYNEDDDSASPVELTTSNQDFASITFTPDNDGDDWLVIGSVKWEVDSTASNTLFWIRRDGTEAAPADDAPLFSMEGENTAEFRVRGLHRGYNLDNTPHTFAIQGRDDSASSPDNHYYSSIFALRLHAFEDHGIFWDEDEIAVDDWVEIGTLDITPTTTGTFVLLGQSVTDITSFLSHQIRTQNDEVDIPTGQSSSEISQFYDADDELPAYTLALPPLATGGSRALDLDEKTTQAGAESVEDRSLVAFSLELAGGAPAGGGAPTLPLVGVE